MSDPFELQHNDTVWYNATLATMDPSIDDQYGLLQGHALITRGDKIAAIIPTDQYALTTHPHKVDLQGALVTPGLIDCHTHLIFAGNRATEWEQRLNGTPYSDIAQQGGGINSTVMATRAATHEILYQSSEKRLQSLMNEGVTTVEIKSGYGLDLDSERKQLVVAQALQQQHPIDISPTLLAAHAVPLEFKGHADTYLNEICQHILPQLWQEKRFEAVDIFTENIAFNLNQTQRLFSTAHALGIPVKAHVEQLSNLGGSALVAQFNGWSVDHLEYLDEQSIIALRQARTVATLLPGAFYFLRETTRPPIELLRKHQVPMAVASDFNPGTSPFASIRLAMNMACTLFRLTPAEALAGTTRHAAMALGRSASHGQLKADYQANFAVWEVASPVEIFYELGYNPLKIRVFNGKYSHLPSML